MTAAAAIDERIAAAMVDDASTYRAWAQRCDSAAFSKKMPNQQHTPPRLLVAHEGGGDLDAVCAMIAPRPLWVGRAHVRGIAGAEAFPSDGFDAVLAACAEAYRLTCVETSAVPPFRWDFHPKIDSELVSWLASVTAPAADAWVCASPTQYVLVTEQGMDESTYFTKVLSARDMSNAKLRIAGVSDMAAMAITHAYRHKPWDYLKWKCATASVATPAPSSFGTVHEWEQRKAEYLTAHATALGYTSFGIDHVRPSRNPPMSSCTLGVIHGFVPPPPPTTTTTTPQTDGHHQPPAATLVPPAPPPFPALPAVTREDVLYNFDGSACFVPAYVYYPSAVGGGESKPEKRPAVVMSPGWGQARDNSEFVNLGMALAQAGFIAIAMDHVDEGQRSSSGPAANAGVIDVFCTLLGSCLEGFRGADLVRAVDYLVTRPDVDAARIGVVGLCSGSISMWSGVCMDPRIASIVHVSGATTNLSWAMDFAQAGDSETAFPAMLKHGDWDTVAATYAPRPFAILQNRDDFWWPKPGYQQVVDSATAVYKLYGAGGAFVHQFFNAIHTVDSPFREAIVQRFLDTLQ